VRSLKRRFYEKVRVTPSDPAGCWEWVASFNGRYGQIGVGAVPLLAHRVSYELHVGPIPDGMHIDHICRNTHCVNPDHLRLATPAQNAQNLGLSAKNTTGFRGVSYDKKSGKFVAKVKRGGHTHYVGSFPTAEEAGRAATERRLLWYSHNVEDRMTA